jgi:hypothetical protein
MRRAISPVQGVIVGASRVLEGGLAGGNQLDRMMAMEAVTDSAGKFSLPAWGPKKVPSYPWVYSNARLKEMDPQLFLFQDEHRYLSLFGAGDVTGALTGFAPGARDKFQNAFQNLQQDPATVVSQLGAMRGLSLSASDTEYQLVRPSSGTASAYPVYFIRGEDGVWRINEM